MIRLVDAVYRWLVRTVALLTAMCLITILAVTVANVVARYFGVLGGGLVWAGELSQILFAWVVFLGAFLALDAGAHIRVDLVERYLVKKRLQTAYRRLLLCLVLVFLVIYTWQSYKLTRMTWHERTPVLGLSNASYYAALPISGVLMVIAAVRLLITGEDPAVAAEDIDRIGDAAGPAGESVRGATIQTPPMSNTV